MPVNTSMTTIGSSALRIQYIEFAICVQRRTLCVLVKFGTKLAETMLHMMKSVKFSDTED